MVSRKKLHEAFAFLEGKGFVAPREAWQCCSSCGCAALPDGTTKFVFYHKQDLEGLKAGQGMFLTFGETLDEGKDIIKVLEAAGVPYAWDGTLSRRIEVYPRLH